MRRDDRGPWAEEFVAQWRELRAAGAGPEEFRRLEERFPAGYIRLAVSDNGEARLLLPVLGDYQEGWEWRGVALLAKDRKVRDKEQVLRVLEIRCLRQDLEALFGEFAADVVRQMREGRSARRSFREALRRLRALARPELAGTWTAERIGGVLAELLFLRRLVGLGLRTAEHWTGPGGGARDFNLPGLAVEVKGAIGMDRNRIVIHGLRQLELRQSERLLLVQYGLVVSENGLTVGDMARELDAMLRDDPSWHERLVHAGIDPHGPPDAPWNTVQFDVTGTTWFEVRDGFPRLASDLLRDPTVAFRIERVSYVLDPADLLDYQLPETAVDTLLRDAVSRIASAD